MSPGPHTWVCLSDKIALLYFLRLSKVWSMLHHGSVGWVSNKECYYMFTYTFLVFLSLFFIIKFVLLLFLFLFLIKSQISTTIRINQSETWIGGFQMSAELYDIEKNGCLCSLTLGPQVLSSALGPHIVGPQLQKYCNIKYNTII